MINNIVGWRLQHLFWVLSLSLFVFPHIVQAQMGLKLPPPPKTVDLFEKELIGLEGYSVDSTFFAQKPKAFRRTITIDSSGTYITIRETLDDVEYYFPAIVDLPTYVSLRLDFNMRQMFKEKFSNAILGQKEADFGAIELDIPIRIRSETFTRIFGSDRISLRVTGNISFDLSGRSEKRSGSATNSRQNQNTFSPRFSQTQQFTVEGKIGEKVTVSVQQNSEAVTDIDNTLKLRYDGEEDEIVEKIEAGNISLSLPSTKYVTFGGVNKGLFGLKADMHLGNLYLTTIASLEKGEQQELKITGSSQASTSEVKDINFIKYRYFFIGKNYRENWEKGFEGSPDLQIFKYDENQQVEQLDVWISVGSTDPLARDGVAVIDPNDARWINVGPGVTPAEGDVGKVYEGSFKKLEEDQYSWDPYRGFFWLNQAVDESKNLAIAYSLKNGAKVGTLVEDDSTGFVLLKMIKPDYMQPDEKYSDTWPLMMRNVYSLGGSNIEEEGFDIDIRKINDQQSAQGDNSFLNLLGLDIVDENGGPIEAGDGKVDLNDYFIDRFHGTLIFPGLQPFNPEDGSRFNGLLEANRRDFYNTTSNIDLQSLSTYDLVITSKSTRSTFDLGFYVLEGSDVVTLNGRTLDRDKDYLIDYFSGQLTLISNEAKRSSSDLSIKYERANLFQLDKKTILGGRLEYKFLDNSFIGMTALYLSKSTLDRRVRVGQEPFQNLVWDVNAAFKFKPRFLTDLVDALPFVETTDESQFSIEGEFAQVIPDPNTRNSGSTGDDNGVAYIDDFEASKRLTTLGIRYRTWTAASPPLKINDINQEENPLTLRDINLARAHLNWFNPFNQYAIRNIWPQRDVNSQTGQTTDVLGLEFWRDEGADQDSAWVGIMRSTATFSDQQKTKYIELWVKGYTGTINIDLGKISEDWYHEGLNYRQLDSFGNLNTEDKNNSGYLEDNEDTGIDGIAGTSDDRWEGPVSSSKPTDDGYSYDNINGTEGNADAQGARYPDTEDLDGNGNLDKINSYYTYSFSLDSNDVDAQKYISGSTRYDNGSATGWRQFRIPLSEPSDSVGNPDRSFSQVINVRLWISDIKNTTPKRIYIATLDYVGNEWEEEGYKIPVAGQPEETDLSPFIKSDSVFTLTAYNTEENTKQLLTADAPDAYTSPPGVKGVRDRVTNTLSKEQSVVMRFQKLPAGAIAEARKTLFNKLALINYSRLKMFMYGSSRSDPRIPDSPEVDSSKVRFYMRFGADNNNYYEYGQDVYESWNKLNNIDIDLDELSSVGFNEKKLLPGSPGAYYKSQGNASLTTIRFIVFGVENKNPTEFTGEIWLDELRLSDVRKENATALRLQTNIKFADLLRITAEWESKDADFHNISQQWGSGSTLERQNYSGAINIDKFLPASWDMSIPVDARASFTRNIPKYIPQTDVLTGYKNDTISKKLKSLFGLAKLPKDIEDEVTQSETVGFGTTIKKRGLSNYWLSQYTIDQLVFDFDYSRQKQSNWDIKYNESRSFKESYSFKIPFGNSNFIKPFEFVGNVPVLKEISDTKLYYSPSSFNVNLNVSDSQSKQLRRDSTATEKRTQTTSTSRSVSGAYRIFDNLNLKYNRTHLTDADFDSISRGQLYKNIVTKLDFGREVNIRQSVSADYKLDVISWLSPNFGFNNNYQYTLTNGYQYKQASSRTTKRIGLSISPDKLVNSIYTPPKETKTSRTRARPRKSNVVKDQGEKEDQSEEDKNKNEDEEGDSNNNEEDSEKSSFPNPLMVIYNVFKAWKNVKVDYSIGDNITNPFLSGVPKWDYQFGFTHNPGVPQDRALEEDNIVIQPPTIDKTSQLKTSTSVNILQNVRASFSHNYRTATSIRNNTKTGSASISYLALSDDPLKSFGGITSDLLSYVPDWNVQVTGLEKIPFFAGVIQNLSLDHSHSGKYDEKRKLNSEGTKYEPYAQTFANNWAPLVGINIRTVWGIGATVRMNESKNFSYQTGGSASRSETSSFTISMNYSKSTGFRIPIPIWPFKGKTFKNEINFTLTYDASTSQTYNRKVNSKKFEELQKNSSWKLRPSATYKFNTRVQGSMFYETGATKNKISGEYSYSEFGITVNIAIRD